MKKNTCTSVLSLFLVAALAGCSKAADAPQAPSSTPAQLVQPVESARLLPKKKVPVNEIDFSKYPGVTKPAAFGYYFGLTPEQIQEAGIELEFGKDEDYLVSYRAKLAPLGWDGAKRYLLLFYKNALIKIVAIGESITEDSNGRKGKVAYKDLLDVLIEKYGKPNDSVHDTGLAVYKNRDEFYQCLIYDGCGMWADLFNLSDRTVFLELKGLERGEGYISISYEASPEFAQARERVKAVKKEQSKKGL